VVILKDRSLLYQTESRISYCPIACWTWNANGWLFNLPSLDYAGGGPVHIASGCSALAYALVLGKRKLHGQKNYTKPHNVSMVFIGTTLIWFGWFGFNVSANCVCHITITDRNRAVPRLMAAFGLSWRHGTQMSLLVWA
jgi:ammonia channel protein AmtB